MIAMNSRRRGAARAFRIGVAACAFGAILALPATSEAKPHPTAHRATARPWMNTKLSADTRATMLLRQMTLDEKLALVSNLPATAHNPADVPLVPPYIHGHTAGVTPGVDRLGIQPQWQADGPTGVVEQGDRETRSGRTALPSTLAVTATWNAPLAAEGGAMIGAQARALGINVLLAGGVNLTREPRGGRNFEYGGEDPLLAGEMIGSIVKGVQSNHIISTLKHFAFNAQETARGNLSAEIDESSARMSDLLAFEIAIDKSHAGSVMCAYNKINGVYSCGNDWLLNQVLKRDWHYPGYVISDWGGVHDVTDANAGTDQSTGHSAPLYQQTLRDALKSGKVAPARLDDMVHRILRSMFAAGLFDHPISDKPLPVDWARDAQVSQRVAEQGIVLLKNEGGILPLAAKAQSIAVIGGHADAGVISGGGSGSVWPVGGNAIPPPKVLKFPGYPTFNPSSPMKAIAAGLPGAKLSYASGDDVAAAVALAKKSDVVIVFGTQWASEMVDVPMSLDSGQDTLIAAVAEANPHTVVVLETGGPIAMPWLAKVPAVIEAWYPGANGGAAIGKVLTGQVNPSGRLPVTFPAAIDQLPRLTLEGTVGSGSDLQGAALTPGAMVSPKIDYNKDGAAVGYKWFDRQGLRPIFPFGFGLSYTRFVHDGLTVARSGSGLRASFTARNTGSRAGRDVAQVYVARVGGGWEAPKRLGGWANLQLAPGAKQNAVVDIDPRLLAVYDTARHAWRIAGGDYRVMVGTSSQDLDKGVVVTLPTTVLKTQ